MANYNFGEVILSTIREEKRRRQEAEQFNQQMAENRRQYDLMQKLREEQFLEGRKQFGEEMGLRKEIAGQEYALGKERNLLTQQGLEQEYELGLTGLGLRKEEFDWQRKFGTSKLAQDESQFARNLALMQERILSDSLLNAAKEKQKSTGELRKELPKLLGNLQTGLELLKSEKVSGDQYWEKKSAVMGDLREAIVRSGIPEEAFDIIRSSFDENDAPEIKREKIFEGIKLLKSKYGADFDDEQEKVLRYWAELGTR